MSILKLDCFIPRDTENITFEVLNSLKLPERSTGGLIAQRRKKTDVGSSGCGPQPAVPISFR